MSPRRDGHFAAGGQEGKRSFFRAAITRNRLAVSDSEFPPQSREIVVSLVMTEDRIVAPCGATSNGERAMSRIFYLDSL